MGESIHQVSRGNNQVKATIKFLMQLVIQCSQKSMNSLVGWSFMVMFCINSSIGKGENTSNSFITFDTFNLPCKIKFST